MYVASTHSLRTFLRSAGFIASFAALILFSGSPPAFAVDGVIDINSAVVAQGGFPFAITASGSYRLTGNLSVPSGSDGIDVTADNVTIDLNGFAIVGSAGSGGNGIASSNSQVTVHNGSILGMGGNGIILGNNSTVDDVHVSANGGNGIELGGGGMVKHCTVTANQNDGILFQGSGDMAVENTVQSNTKYGLQMTDTSSGFARNIFLFNNGNHTLGSLSPPQLNPAPSGVASQIGQNMCNANACQ